MSKPEGITTVDDFEEVAERFVSHRNRRQQLKERSVKSLTKMLSQEFSETARKGIEKELDRRFRCLYRLRAKG